jgi:hypothetical protein
MLYQKGALIMTQEEKLLITRIDAALRKRNLAQQALEEAEAEIQECAAALRAKEAQADDAGAGT